MAKFIEVKVVMWTSDHQVSLKPAFIKLEEIITILPHERNEDYSVIDVAGKNIVVFGTPTAIFKLMPTV